MAVKVPERSKEHVQEVLEDSLEYLKVFYIQTPPLYEFLKDLSTIELKWRGNYCYLVSIYVNEDGEKTERKFGRLEYLANHWFKFSYLRHNGKWSEVASKVDIYDCAKLIEETDHFLP